MRTKEELFDLISESVKSRFTPEFIKSLVTIRGLTQAPERKYITLIRDILDEMGLTYTQASSQQSKDFRNVGEIGLNIEVKKTDNFTVKCNDTCPCEDIYYIIIHTGKTTRSETYPPQLLFKNGQEFVSASPWSADYIKDMNIIKDKYCRGEAARELPGPISVYTRPNWSIAIREWLVSNVL